MNACFREVLNGLWRRLGLRIPGASRECQVMKPLSELEILLLVIFTDLVLGSVDRAKGTFTVC